MTLRRRVVGTFLFTAVCLVPLWLVIRFGMGLGVTTRSQWSAHLAATMICGFMLAAFCTFWTLRGMRWSSRAGVWHFIRMLLAALVSAEAGVLVADREGPIVAFVLFVGLCLLFTFQKLESLPAEALRLKRRHGDPTAAEIYCPACGYNLRGLYHTRCPECGVEHTLDQLLQANLPKRHDDRSG